MKEELLTLSPLKYDVSGDILFLDFENLDPAIIENKSNSGRIVLKSNDQIFTSSLEARYGSKSLNYSSNGYLYVSDNDQTLIPETFTIDFWYKNKIGFNQQWLVEKTNLGTTNCIKFYRGELYFQNSASTLYSVKELPLNTWFHLAWSSSGNNNYFFIDGTLKREVNSTGRFGKNNISLKIAGGIIGYPDNGFIDNFRLSPICRWTSDFNLTDIY